MTDRVRALVVGGGVVGVSIAYHLAKAGWQETMLIERDELTSGSTWHAAGLLPLFNLNYSASHIHRHSISLYRTLENETGLDPGFRPVGNLRMAQTEDRMREYMLYASTADTIDIPYAFLTPAEIAERYPLVRTDDLRGAIFHPTDGYINPADLTQALARGARQLGVTIQKRRQLDAMEWTGSEWIVSGSIMLEAGGNLIESPERFAIHTEHVIMATGNHAQRTAAILGITSPAIPVEHQYIVTDVDPVLAEWRKENPEHPVLRDPDARWYLREERGGWLLGPYEDGAPARFAHGVPKTFRSDLFNLDLDRIEAEYQSMLHRVPSSEQCGLKGDFNGPICYTPDGNPLLGPAPGLRNVWLAEGFSFGVTTAGGAGYYLAQTIVDGEAGIDMISFDPRRFGDWITKRYAIEKNEECYATFLKLHHPDEERPACRPLRCAPCYDRLRSRGAQFGQVNGWERPNYFAPQDFDDHAARSFHQGGWWPYARAEASAVRSTVGILDATAFAKHEILGPGATQFLDWYTANRLPSVGRVSLTHALTPAGTVCSEFTVARLAGDRYFLVSAGAWASYDGDCLRKAALDKHVEFGPIEIRDVSTRWGCFVLAGPNARSLMTDLLEHPDPATALCNENFPWLAHRTLELGMCPVRVLRVSYTGSPGWELYHPLEMQNYLFDLVERHGAPHKLKDFGARAQNWLRMEKSYRAFGAELGRDITLHEAGLERFIDNEKDFRGKQAMLETAQRSACVTLLISCPPSVSPWGRESIWVGGDRIGRLTSGGWSVLRNTSIGMGYVHPDFSAPGTGVEVRIMNTRCPATIVEDSPYDPDNLVLQGG